MQTTPTSVVFEHVAHVLGVNKGVIDGHHLDLGVLQRGTQRQAANAAKPCAGTLLLILQWPKEI